MENAQVDLNAAHEKMKKFISKMTLKSNYWGYLFSRIHRIPSTDIPSIMGVAPLPNGTIGLMFDPVLVMNTEDDVLAKVVEHEGMHVLNKHIPRLIRLVADEGNKKMQQIKSDIFNIASDCAVNPIIKMPKEIQIGGRPFCGCFPEFYGLEDKQATEYYYDALLKNVRQVLKAGGQPGKLGDEFDKIGDHSGWGKGAQGVSDKTSLARKVDHYTQRLIADSAKSFQKRRGKLPAHIRRLIEEALAPPKAPYFQIIRKLVKGSRYSKFKRAFAKVNRKRTYVFAISGSDKKLPVISPFPGRTRDFTFNVGIGIDTSGSMSMDDIKEGLSGCRNIFENDRHCKVTVIENDAEIGKEYELKRVSDIDFEVTGGGGTTLAPAVRRFKELNPDVVIFFTDGHCDNINAIPRRELPKKIIWVIQDGGETDKVNETGYIVRI